MPTEIVKTPDRMTVSSTGEKPIYIYGETAEQIIITNNISEEFDASSFYIVIVREDWEEIKTFIDKNFH